MQMLPALGNMQKVVGWAVHSVGWLGWVAPRRVACAGDQEVTVRS